MKKIKSVKFNSYILTKEFYKWELEDRISFSEEFIRDNEHLFEIEYENENFKMEIPELSVLRRGYFVSSSDGYYICQDYNSGEHLFGIYKTGNWYATREQAAKELSFRKTKMFVNKLIEWCDAQSGIVKSCKIEYVNEGNYFHCSYYNNSYYNQIIFNSSGSANLFIKQIDLPENETHRSNLIQILKSGRL